VAALDARFADLDLDTRVPAKGREHLFVPVTSDHWAAAGRHERAYDRFTTHS
jgi:uncharacterized protein YifE (UPF0438 family)